MAGGIGSRFWPISRQGKPKQFLDILGTGKTFLRATFERFLPLVPAGNFLVVTNAQYRDLVLEQLPELGEHQVLGEPIGRNTAPCVAFAGFRIAADNEDAEIIVTPADHLVVNEADFREIVGKGLDYISDRDAMMTIGIKPDNPNTGYGYIQLDSAGIDPGEIREVKTFTEKPGREMAVTFVESGEFLWNSGIFLWSLSTFKKAMREYLPDMYGLFEANAYYFGTPEESVHIQQIYSDCKPVSIDIGIMEKARNVYVCCGDFGWSDIGTWGALYEQSAKDENGNVVPPRTLVNNSSGLVVRLKEGRTAVIDGLHDYIVVDTDDVLLICPKSQEQEIKNYVEELKFRGFDDIV